MTPTAPKNVDEYIAGFPQDVQQKLEQVRTRIKKAVPEAEEVISYQMPAFKYKGMLVFFAGYKNHIGFYATPQGHSEFSKELAGYKQGKGSVQFPLDKPMPLSLIGRIAKYKALQNLKNEEVTKKKK